MRIQKPLRFAALVIPALLSLIPALCLVPAATAQSTGTQNTVVITGSGGQTIHPGDTVVVGYQASIADPNSISNTVSVGGANLKVSVKCSEGSFTGFTLNGPSDSIDIPANSSAFLVHASR